MSNGNTAAQTLEQRVLEQALKRGWGQVGGDPLSFLLEVMERDAMLVEAAQEWSEERIPHNAADTELLRTVRVHSGGYTGACDGEGDG